MEECQRKEKFPRTLFTKLSVWAIIGSCKTRLLSWKISWVWSVFKKLVRKFSYWRNLLLLWMMLNKASVPIWILNNNSYVKKSSHLINLWALKLNTAATNIDRCIKTIRNGHCVKSIQIRKIRTEYRKIRTRKNFVFGHLSRSRWWSKKKLFLKSIFEGKSCSHSFFQSTYFFISLKLFIP